MSKSKFDRENWKNENKIVLIKNEKMNNKKKIKIDSNYFDWKKIIKNNIARNSSCSINIDFFELSIINFIVLSKFESKKNFE